MIFFPLIPASNLLNLSLQFLIDACAFKFSYVLGLGQGTLCSFPVLPKWYAQLLAGYQPGYHAVMNYMYQSFKNLKYSHYRYLPRREF